MSNTNDKPVYWDDEEKKFYWIEWYDTGNSEIPTRYYIHLGEGQGLTWTDKNPAPRCEYPDLEHHLVSYTGPCCPLCNSDYPKRFWFFGKRYCINTNCKNRLKKDENEKTNNVQWWYLIPNNFKRTVEFVFNILFSL